MSPNPKNAPSAKPAAHPLSGADLATLAALLRKTGPLPPRAWPQAALAWGSALGRFPFTAMERGYVAAVRRGRSLAPPPVFLLGHWRSGTTHLYNLMGQAPLATVDPIAAGLPWDFLLLGRWLRPLLERALPEGRFIDSMKVTPTSPQEDELAIANMTSYSFYHAIYFPRRFDRLFDRGLFLDDNDPAAVRCWFRQADHFFWKVQRQQRKRPLVIKNPVYTARAKSMAALWPNAKFIHIIRNPHEVFASTRSFFGKLFEALALQPHRGLGLDPEEIALRTYPRLMEPLIADWPGLPAENKIELRFEDLEADPIGSLRQIFDRLELPGFEAALPGFEAHLAEVRSYRRAQRSFPEADLAKVEAAWGRYLDHWSYGRP